MPQVLGLVGQAVLPVPTRQEPGRIVCRTRATTARRALLIGLAVFAVLQLGFREAVVTDRLTVGDPVWTYRWDGLRHRPDPPTLLAVGSSRTQMAFAATRFTDATGIDSYNFATPAGGSLTTALYVRRLLAEGVRPNSLLVELHPGFLTPSDPPFEARWLHPYRLRPGEPEQLRAYGWAVPDPPQHGWRGYLAATSVWRMGLLNEFAPVWLPCPFGLTPSARTDSRGWVEGIVISAAEKPRAIERTREHYAPVLEHYHVGGPGCAAVRDILAVCREHGIRATLLLTPESSEHRGWYGPAGYAAVTRFAHSLGVPVVDARDWLPDELIADGHHLTPAGAAVFTDRLAAEWHTRSAE